MGAGLDSHDPGVPLQPMPELRCVGLATRVIAFTVDAALINLVAIIVEVGVALILSLFHLPQEAKTIIAAIGGLAYVVWTIGYFVTFWSGTGQTPGARLMHVRLVTTSGERVRSRRALLRCAGMVLAALPLFLGYVRILYDSRRRGFPDRLAGTLVVEAPQQSYAEVQRARRRAAYESAKRRPSPVAR